MEDGKVKSYSAAVDLGFIEPTQGGADVLFQKHVVKGGDPEDLQRGDVLKFDAQGEDPDRVATKVVIS